MISPSAPAATAARAIGSDLVAQPGAVTGIDHDRKVTQLVDHRHRGDVERIAGVALEGPNPPLAEDHVRYCRPRGTYSAESSHSSTVAEMPRLRRIGLRRLPQLPQQGEILHVPGPDLQHVRILLDEGDLPDVHDLGDQLEVVAVRRPPQDLEPLFAQSLKAVW